MAPAGGYARRRKSSAPAGAHARWPPKVAAQDPSHPAARVMAVRPHRAATAATAAAPVGAHRDDPHPFDRRGRAPYIAVMALVVKLAVLVLALAVLPVRGHADTAPVAEPASRRTTTAGDVVGFVGEYGSFVWLGIPYAAPPVGERRWRAPDAARAVGRATEALAAGSACPQLASALGGGHDVKRGEAVGSEDCLYLNVYAPRTARAGRRPPARHGVDPRRRQHHRPGGLLRRRQPGRAAERDRGDASTTGSAPSAGSGTRRCAAGDTHAGRTLGQLRHARPHPRARVGARQRRGLRRRSAQRHRLRRVRRRHRRLRAPAVAAGARPLPACHRAERRAAASSTPAAAEHRTDAPEPGDPHSSAEVVLALLMADGSAPDRAAAIAKAAAMSDAELARWLRAKSPAELLRRLHARPRRRT